jgi:pimeloyl-ACP methyl ester carboxylesterase
MTPDPASLSPLHTRPTVLLCHGLWMPSAAMFILAQRLRQLGWQAVLFNYPSTRQVVDDLAAALLGSIQRLGDQGQPVHVIGHSLGGLLAIHMLKQHGACCQGGRMVCLGSPLTGSGLARWGMTQYPLLTPRVLGQSRDTLIPGITDCPTHTEVGMVAGTRPYGMGIWVTHLAAAWSDQVARGRVRPWMGAWAAQPPVLDPELYTQPNDGTVMVSETHVPGLHAHTLVDSTHTRLTLDRPVAHLCDRFLRTGQFDAPQALV